MRLLCRQLPCIPQSLRTAPELLPCFRGAPQSGEGYWQGSNPGAVRVKCRGIPCGCPKSWKLIEIFRFSPFCLMLRLTPSGVDRWFALLKMTNPRFVQCWGWSCAKIKIFILPPNFVHAICHYPPNFLHAICHYPPNLCLKPGFKVEQSWKFEIFRFAQNDKFAVCVL